MTNNKDKEYPTNAQLIEALTKYSEISFEPFAMIFETDNGYRFYLTKEQACAIAAARLMKLLDIK